jgi:hypothetical protein
LPARIADDPVSHQARHKTKRPAANHLVRVCFCHAMTVDQDERASGIRRQLRKFENFVICKAITRTAPIRRSSCEWRGPTSPENLPKHSPCPASARRLTFVSQSERVGGLVVVYGRWPVGLRGGRWPVCSRLSAAGCGLWTCGLCRGSMRLGQRSRGRLSEDRSLVQDDKARRAAPGRV